MNDRDSQHSTERFGDDFAARLADLEARATAEEQAAIAALPAGSALLIVRRGPTVGARFLLDQDVTIAGRHPDADIFLDDVTVSRRHAEISRSGSTFTISDLESLNGIFVDGERVPSSVLTDGTEVHVGKYRMTFYPSRHDPQAGS